MPIQFTCPHCGTETDVADEFAGHSGPCVRCGKTITVPPLAAPPGYGPPARSSSTGPGLVILVVVGGLILVAAVIGILIALLLPAVQSAREAARKASSSNNVKQISLALNNYHRVQCANNLKQISLALLNYEAANGCFPPAYVADENGRPMHSWRVLILPYLEQQALYDRYNFDEPWDSANNRMVADAVISLYRCPSAPQTNSRETNYVMIVGPETVAYENSAIGMADISDGASNTIMVIETADSGIRWAEPRDLNLDALNLRINDGTGEGIRSHHRGGVNAAFCDGSVHFLNDSLDREILRRLINRKDAMRVDYSSF